MTPLAATFQRLNTLPHIQVQLGVPQGEGWFTLASLGTALMDDLMQQFLPDGDRKAQAVSYFARINWLSCAVAVGMYLTEQRCPILHPDKVWVHFNTTGSTDAVALADSHFYALTTDPDASAPEAMLLRDQAALRDMLRQQLEAHLLGVIEHLHRATRLGKPALWINLADRIGWALLTMGSQQFSPDQCAAEMDLLLQAPGSPLNGNTGITLVEHEGQCQPFLKRGGCCLFYKLPGNTYCATCPIQSDEVIARRLREYVTTH